METNVSVYKKARYAAHNGLARRYQAEYRRLYAEALARDPEPETPAGRARARLSARCELARRHPGTYQRLLRKARSEDRVVHNLPAAQLAVHFWDLWDDRATPRAVVGRFLDRRHAALQGLPVPPIPDKDRRHLERNARVIGLEAKKSA